MNLIYQFDHALEIMELINNFARQASVMMQTVQPVIATPGPQPVIELPIGNDTIVRLTLLEAVLLIGILAAHVGDALRQESRIVPVRKNGV